MKGSKKDDKGVRFQLPGTGKGRAFDDMNKDLNLKQAAQTSVLDEQPKALKKQKKMDDLERRKNALTIDEIDSDSKSNKAIIYKFMKKGFNALSAEELACTMVNPTFSVDFKKNAFEDWN